MASLRRLYHFSRIHQVCYGLIVELNQPATWSVHRTFHTSGIWLKKRKEDQSEKPKYPGLQPSKFKQKGVVEVWKDMTMNELASALGKDINYVLDIMEFVDNSVHYRKGHQVIDNWKVIEEVIKKAGKRFKIISKPEIEQEEESKDLVRRDPSEYKDPRPRPAVVTIMGHVDHGKTTLLDTLRNSSVVDSEFGGITQHIGAFSVTVNKNDRITFLDTPGHAAFCSMRNRGAQCTDIVVLVVAADDGVMEQTIESINMAKQAKVPILVAINKIDKPSANIDQTKKMLLQHGLQVEDYGGDIQAVPISALKGTNIELLMDAISLQAEIMDLKSDYSGPVEGVVIESTTDPYRGKLSTLLVQCGTLKKGAILVAGTSWCRVRVMFNDNGETIQQATPSTPVQVLGWKELPSAGDVTIQVPSEKKAVEIIDWRKKQELHEKMKEDQVVIDKKMLEHYEQYRKQLEEKRRLGYFKMKRKGPREKEYIDTDTGPKLSVVIKGDVDGSVEAILDVLETYGNDKCKLDVVHYGVGPVTKNDVILAKTFNGIVYTFNTGILPDTKEEIKSQKVVTKSFNVIYKLIDDIKSEMGKLLPMLDEEEEVGVANVLQEFIINEGKSKVPVAGSRCTKGKLSKSALFKLVRNNETLFQGKVTSLKHFKDEVESIKKDMECGIRLSDQSINVQPGDTIICYKINKVPQKIDWDPGF